MKGRGINNSTMITRMFFIEPHYAVHWNETTGKVRITSTSSMKKGAEIKTCLSAEGYLQAKINNSYVRLHILIADHIFGPRKKGYVINHIDAVKTNNARANLEVVTQGDNVRHAIRMGLHVASNPKRMPTYKDGRTMGGREKKNAYKLSWWHANKLKKRNEGLSL